MAVLVPNRLVESNEGYGKTINQFFNLFIEPYYQGERHVFKKEDFVSAIIEIFDDGRKPKIRLNEDARIALEFKSQKIKSEDVGKKISIDLKEIKSVSWSSAELDENSAKALVIRFNQDWWILNFDFRYNQGDVKKKLERASEFYSSCETILRKKEYCPHVLIYLIWATAELLLDAKLLQHAQRAKRDHDDKKKKLKSPIGQSFFSADFQTMLLNLYKIRNGARYGNKDFSKKYKKSDLRAYVEILKLQAEQI